MSSEYVTNSLVWSAVGLMFGVVLGMGIRIKFLYWRLEEKNRDRVIGALLILTALGSVVQGLAFQREQRRITQCQVDYNTKFQQTLQERAEIADRDRNNVNVMVVAILQAKGGDAVRTALEHYTKVNHELVQDRVNAEYPAETREDTCKKRLIGEGPK